jgi:peptidyl-prolyl cis-trans isomerase A (cyclophilin A)
MRRLRLLLMVLLLPACTAELKEENNALNDRVSRLQMELAASETARSELTVQLQDADTRQRRLEAATRYGFDLSQGLWARLMTSMGEIVCELYPAEAPETVDNFVRLAEGRKEWFDRSKMEMVTRPLYDGTTFHRVIADRFVQGGAPDGSSEFSPGYRFPDELHPDRKVVAGALAMANSGPDTNGTQFFIAAQDLPDLDGLHTVFGGCEPLDVVLDLSRVAVDEPGSDHPADPPKLARVIIHRGTRPHPATTP